MRTRRDADLSDRGVSEREGVHDVSAEIVVAAPVLLLGLRHHVQQTDFVVPAQQDQPAKRRRRVAAKQKLPERRPPREGEMSVLVGAAVPRESGGHATEEAGRGENRG